MEMKKCLQCGNEFVPSSIKGQEHKYCTKKCRGKYSNDKRSELFYKLLGKEKFTPTLKNCIYCDNEYIARTETQKYCSNKCKNYSHSVKYNKFGRKDNCLILEFLPVDTITEKLDGYGILLYSPEKNVFGIWYIGILHYKDDLFSLKARGYTHYAVIPKIKEALLNL